MHHKGIIMAGGSGTRLWPMTLGVNKQLLPIYDKPMIYYPLTMLMEAGIRDILLITSVQDLETYQALMQDGSQWGVSISYATQDSPKGIAEAFIVGKPFIAQDNVTLILGDNIFYGSNITHALKKATKKSTGATIFAYYVQDPMRYGVLVFSEKGKPLAIEEKPKHPQSHYAVTGLYCYDNRVVEFAKHLKPSGRGELEITDINNLYLQEQELDVEILNRGTAWLDTGTPASLLDAAHFIHTIEARQGLKVGCPEEVAWRMGYIDDEALARAATRYSRNDYGQYLLNLLSHQQFLEKMEIN